MAEIRIIDKKSSNYQFSQREEMVEDIIRKIAVKNRLSQADNKKITYFEVQVELLKLGHNYTEAEIKSAVELLSKQEMEVTVV